MCGLMAGSGKLDAGTITALCCMNVTRGKDSAGIGWADGQDSKIAKIAEHPLAAFNGALRKSILEASKHGAVIGHTRAATQGKVTSKNAHPYLVDNIAWAHNGVITNDEDFGKFDVDSQCLIAGIKARDFSAYQGPIALVWIESGKLCAYRKGNPLFRGRKGRAVYLASERVFLERVGCKKVKELSEGKLYVFDGVKIESSVDVPQNKVYVYQREEVETCGINYNAWPDNDRALVIPTMAMTVPNPDVPPIQPEVL